MNIVGSDNDLGFGFTDGGSYVAAVQADNNGGSLFYHNGGLALLVLVQGGIGFSQDVTAAFNVADGGGPTNLDFSNDTYSVSGVALPTTLDTDNLLSFQLYANNQIERYRINSVTISVSDTSPVPLPAGGVLLLAGLGGLAALRRRAA